jgi:hypothetical protein
MSLFFLSIYKLPFILSWSLYSSTLFLHCTAMFALSVSYPLPRDVGLNLSEHCFFWLVFWFTFSVGDGDFCCLFSCHFLLSLPVRSFICPRLITWTMHFYLLPTLPYRGYILALIGKWYPGGSFYLMRPLLSGFFGFLLFVDIVVFLSSSILEFPLILYFPFLLGFTSIVYFPFSRVHLVSLIFFIAMAWSLLFENIMFMTASYFLCTSLLFVVY